jgi:hypothetical protein
MESMMSPQQGSPAPVVTSIPEYDCENGDAHAEMQPYDRMAHPQ